METKDWRVWGEPLLAGLPHLLFVLASEGYAFTYYLGHKSLDEQILPLVFLGLIIAALVFAGIKRWPRWSAGWIGYGLALAQLMSLGPGSRYTVDGRVTAGIPFAWANLIFIIQIVAAISISLLLARRDRLSGLLMVLPLVPVSWSMLALDAVRTESRVWLLAATSLAAALLAGGLSRAKRVWRGVGIALAVNLLVSLSVAYVTTYHGLYGITEPTMMDMLSSFIFNLVASSLLSTGPIWGWELLERIWQQLERIRGTR
jgi:hypothetical protein